MDPNFQGENNSQEHPQDALAGGNSRVFVSSPAKPSNQWEALDVLASNRS